MFDKDSLLQRLKALPFSEKEYWVIAGGAMVLHGFRPQTHDIDLGCSTCLADKLEQQGYAVSRCEDGTRKISYSEDIEIFENWIEGTVEIMDGVPVVCVDGLIQMKKKLGREKDFADIALIEKTLDLYIPQYEDLWFRKMLMSDEATMSYNHAYGGTIDFPESKWMDWYDRWVQNTEGKRFYRYLRNGEQKFVGEIAYYYDGEKYITDVIIYSRYRGKGYGKEGLRLLCEGAKKRGIEELYDDIAIDNPAITLFLQMGFAEEYRTEEIVMLKKKLAE